MHTAEQAKELWCPMVRASASEDDQNSSNCGVVKEARAPKFARCIANQCAMWRWGTNGNYEHDCAITGTDLGKPVTPAGYCGMAGAPAAI